MKLMLVMPSPNAPRPVETAFDSSESKVQILYALLLRVALKRWNGRKFCFVRPPDYVARLISKKK
eukprot:scaffold8673_cov126-Cylindrotheca_fusiformis.AAC.6